MANLVGQKLGQYEITEVLGEGGMAAVYRARQTSMKREVAIKVIKPNLIQLGDFVRRFGREAETVAGLSQAHILKVFDYGQQDDMVYLVMELLTGGSLADKIRRDGALPTDFVSHVLEQVGSALDYAHRKGIIHRDLKPHNILFDEENNAYLTDFGLAKLLNDGSQMTQSGTSVGTPAYMAPEQWRGRSIDGRADLYALGIVMYEMLSGKLPFAGDTSFALMHQHVYDPPPSITVLRPELPGAVDRVLKKALSKEPEDRFQSGRDLANAFDLALQGKGPVDEDIVELIEISPITDAEADTTIAPTPAVQTPSGVKPTPTQPVVPPTVPPSAMQQTAAPIPVSSTSGTNPLVLVLLAIIAILVIGGAILLVGSRNGTNMAGVVTQIVEATKLPTRDNVVKTAVQNVTETASAAVALNSTAVAAVTGASVGSTASASTPISTPTPTSTPTPGAAATTNLNIASGTGGGTGTPASTVSAAVSAATQTVQSATEASTVEGTQAGTQMVATSAGTSSSVSTTASVSSAATNAATVNATTAATTNSISSPVATPESTAAVTTSATIAVVIVPTSTTVPTIASSPTTSPTLTLTATPTTTSTNTATPPTPPTAVPTATITTTPTPTFVASTGLCVNPDASIQGTPAAPGIIAVSSAAQLFQGNRMGRGIISKVVWSANGNKIAIASSIGVWLYDAAQIDRPNGGQFLATTENQDVDTITVAFSPDSKTVLAGDAQGIIRVWDLSGDKPKQTSILKDNTGKVLALAFSPDGKMLASGGEDKSVRLWDMSAGKLKSTLSGNTKSVLAVAFSPDGKLVASGGEDSSIQIWMVADGTAKTPLQEHTDKVTGIAFSPDGNTLASVSLDKSLKLWDIAKGTVTKSQTGTDAFQDVAYSPEKDGGVIAAAMGTQVSLWTAKDGTLLQTISANFQLPIQSIALSNTQGTTSIVMANGGSIKVGDYRSAKVTKDVLVPADPFSDKLTIFSLSSDANSAISTGGDANIRIWDIHNKISNTYKLPVHSITQVVYYPTKMQFAYADENDRITLWNGQSNAMIATLEKRHDQPITALVYSQDGRFLGSGSSEKTAYLWNLNTKSSVGLVHNDAITNLAFNTAGTLLASASADHKIRIWDVVSGATTPKLTFDATTDPIQAMVFNRDGSRLASSDGKTIRLWDVATGKTLGTWQTDNPVVSLTFNGDGTLLASATDADNVHQIQVWSVTNCQMKVKVDGHTRRIFSLAFTGDNQALVSAGADGTIRTWNVPK